MTLNGLILANSLKWAAHALLMLFLLRRRVGRSALAGEGLWRTVLTAVPLSAVMGVAVHFVVMGLSRLVPGGTIGEVVVVGVSGLVGVGVYGSLSFLVGVDEIQLLRRAVTGQ
jgi:peptidoglycan biosynthesis protein MviN/MurJ (putative lipid II flippase)